MAAEAGGVVQDTLKYLSRYLKAKRQCTQLLIRTFLYPQIVTYALLVGLVLLLVAKKPEIFTGKHIIFIVIALLVAFFVRDMIVHYYSKGRGQIKWEQFKLKWSTLYIRMLNMQFVELFNNIFKTGLPIVDVFLLIGEAIDNRVYGSEIIQIGNRIDTGVGVAEAAKQCRYFSKEIKYIFETGKHTGEYDRNMDYYIHKENTEITLQLKNQLITLYIIYIGVLAVIIWYIFTTL